MTQRPSLRVDALTLSTTSPLPDHRPTPARRPRRRTPDAVDVSQVHQSVLDAAGASQRLGEVVVIDSTTSMHTHPTWPDPGQRCVTDDGEPAHVKLTPITTDCVALVIDRPGPVYLTRDEMTALIVGARVALSCATGGVSSGRGA